MKEKKMKYRYRDRIKNFVKQVLENNTENKLVCRNLEESANLIFHCVLYDDSNKNIIEISKFLKDFFTNVSLTIKHIYGEEEKKFMITVKLHENGKEEERSFFPLSVLRITIDPLKPSERVTLSAIGINMDEIVE